jgi:hypothetical protein
VSPWHRELTKLSCESAFLHLVSLRTHPLGVGIAGWNNTTFLRRSHSTRKQVDYESSGEAAPGITAAMRRAPAFSRWQRRDTRSASGGGAQVLHQHEQVQWIGRGGDEVEALRISHTNAFPLPAGRAQPSPEST